MDLTESQFPGIEDIICKDLLGAVKLRDWPEICSAVERLMAFARAAGNDTTYFNLTDFLRRKCVEIEVEDRTKAVDFVAGLDERVWGEIQKVIKREMNRRFGRDAVPRQEGENRKGAGNGSKRI